MSSARAWRSSTRSLRRLPRLVRVLGAARVWSLRSAKRVEDGLDRGSGSEGSLRGWGPLEAAASDAAALESAAGAAGQAARGAGRPPVRAAGEPWRAALSGASALGAARWPRCGGSWASGEEEPAIAASGIGGAGGCGVGGSAVLAWSRSGRSVRSEGRGRNRRGGRLGLRRGLRGFWGFADEGAASGAAPKGRSVSRKVPRSGDLASRRDPLPASVVLRLRNLDQFTGQRVPSACRTRRDVSGASPGRERTEPGRP